MTNTFNVKESIRSPLTLSVPPSSSPLVVQPLQWDEHHLLFVATETVETGLTQSIVRWTPVTHCVELLTRHLTERRCPFPPIRAAKSVGVKQLSAVVR